MVIKYCMAQRSADAVVASVLSVDLLLLPYCYIFLCLDHRPAIC